MDDTVATGQTGDDPERLDDSCNSIKCAVFCKDGCGWSRSSHRCEAGRQTSASELEQRLGDCSGTTATGTPTPVPPTAAAQSGTAGPDATIVVLVAALVVVVVVVCLAAFLHLKKRVEMAAGHTAGVDGADGNDGVVFAMASQPPTGLEGTSGTASPGMNNGGAVYAMASQPPMDIGGTYDC